jgi:hypothetical protein
MNHQRAVTFFVLVAALSAPLNISAADPLSDLVGQLNSAGRPLTQEEWCRLALLTMGSRSANEQTRMAINEMARNRGCYAAPQAQPELSVDEQARIAVCRTIPNLLSQPGVTSSQKIEAMKIAKANGCIR